MKELMEIKIPIPSLERQEEIIKDMDEISNSIDTIKLRVKQLKYEGELFKKKFYLKQLNDIFKESEIKTLGEVCEINQGNTLTKIEMVDGIYDVIGGGKIIGKHNQTNREGNDFTLTRVGDININYIDKPYYLTDNGFSLKSKQEDIITKYTYYLLSHNKEYLTNLYQGTAQKVISKTNLKSIKIPIPTLERQEEIIGIYENIAEEHKKNFLDKIEQENQHIEMLKKIAISLFNN
jgi:type I restriction enzyme S subunit